MVESKSPQLVCYVVFPRGFRSSRVAHAVERGIQKGGYVSSSAIPTPSAPQFQLQESIISQVAVADCVIADMSDEDSHVYFVLGLAQAMDKPVLLMAHEQSSWRLPFSLRNYPVIRYTDRARDLARISSEITGILGDFRSFPRALGQGFGPRTSAPFYIDWDSLSPRDGENLCLELLAQLGYRRLDWGKESPEIDLLAELPRKDPDGFEFRELWLISLGQNSPPEMLFDIASYDPNYLIHRLQRYSSKNRELLSRQYASSATLLFIQLNRSISTTDLREYQRRLDDRRDRSIFTLRLRTWDQAYLSSLVQRFPSIAYKYFSQEGRIRSQTRKSYEELYHENTELSNRLTIVVKDLGEEKNKRIRAERDAIWKDISFSAAHKIGNPLFAIETDLGPLKKRIHEKRFPEALEVIQNIDRCVEKAKTIIEQFKSLVKAQQIKPLVTELRPILEEALHSIRQSDVRCLLNCPDGILITADPDRLRECFDELVINATHWFDKQEKIIEISVVHPAPEPLPEFLDTTRSYVAIYVQDNGSGVAVSDKTHIFDAFYTNYSQGTGLGLALARRIVDGHGGGIRETGLPGKGATFEVYLPTEKATSK